MEVLNIVGSVCNLVLAVYLFYKGSKENDWSLIALSLLLIRS